MSTDRQDLSIEVQSDVIAAFAARRGFEVVKSYDDAGRSGLSIATRPGLKRMMADIVAGSAGFDAILVYDVSRWGRFQDIDESAHYEFICRQMGIDIHYCAELFENDGSSLSALMKAMKRVMAAEYSRELSSKVRQSQGRLIARGFWVSGALPFGYRRQVVDRRGQPRGFVLDDGEKKNIKNDRVVLVPAEAAQVETVRRIFDLYVKEGLGRREIAKRLNIAGLLNRRNRPWTESAVTHILRNEIYVGTIVWGREHRPLGRSKQRMPDESHIRVPNAMEPIVDPALFHFAQDIFAHRTAAKDATSPVLLADLRSLMLRNGELAHRLLYVEPEILHSPAYRARFGSMRAAFRELGYTDLPRYRLRVGPHSVKNIRWRLLDELMAGLRARGVRVTRDDSCRHLVIADEIGLAIVLMRRGFEYQVPDAWRPDRYDAAAALVIRAWPWRDDPVDYYLVTDDGPLDSDLPPPTVDPLHDIASFRIAGLETFYAWIESAVAALRAGQRLGADPCDRHAPLDRAVDAADEAPTLGATRRHHSPEGLLL